MCGIAGVISSTKKMNPESFLKGLNQLSLRGPDAAAIVEFDQGILGHRRLSIIDTSAAANQPMHDSSGRYVIVFNGEIFNFTQLKKDKLSKFSINFRTDSDTEVLLYLLIHYGTDCLIWLSGFFAFSFLDKSENALIIARDRLGKKPLLIYEKDDWFMFASEMKALIAFGIPKSINLDALSLYFQFNYLPPNISILQDVRKLKPGHFIQLKNGQYKEECYYQTSIQKEKYGSYSYEEANQKLIQLMKASVQERMISDVPLGAFLSGGIDSSVIVALAAQDTNKLKTFSIGYKDNPLFDESHYAQLVAKKYNTEHNVFFLGDKDYKEEVFNVLNYLDEPFADSSCIPQYILCKKTKPHVTVALSGDGGDEIFSGYHKHKAEWLLRNKKAFAILTKFASPILTKLPQNKNTKLGNLTRQMAKMADGAKLSDRDRYIRWCSILSASETSKLFSKQVKTGIEQNKIETISNYYSSAIQSDDFNEVLLSDVNLVLPGDMLHKVDMMSMANSLEVRSPFLGHQVVDFAFGLPAHFKIDGHLKKKIVQDAFRSYLPNELYNRPKQGFEIPLLEWFRNDFNTFIFDDLLAEKFIAEQQIFDYKQIKILKAKLHSNNPGYVQATIWALIVFQSWYKKYFS